MSESFDPYRLQEIRLRLWDSDRRYYNYVIVASADGKTFTPLVDRSKVPCARWQRLQFAPRPIEALQFVGLYNSTNTCFSVIELEAYCIPPQPPHK